MRPLTKRQVEVYTAITDFIQNNDRCPSFRELADVLGIKSTNGVNDHVKALKKKGLLQDTSKIIPVVSNTKVGKKRRFRITATKKSNGQKMSLTFSTQSDTL